MAAITSSVTLYPSGYTGASNWSIPTSGSYNIANAYKGIGDTSSSSRISVNTSATGYVYLTFDTSSIPSDATIVSITGTVQVRVSNTTRVTNTVCQLYTNTTAKGSNKTFASTSTSNQVTLDAGNSWTRSEVSNLRLKIGATGSSSSQTKYVYLYGAEVTINYSAASYDITLTNNTTATANLSETVVAEGGSFDINIDTLTGINVTDNGVNINNLFGTVPDATVSQVPSSTFTTGTSNSSTNFYQSSSTTSTSWLEYAIGHSAENPYSTSNTSNTYAKPEGQTAWINYHFDFSDIPSAATIESVSVKVYGARENTTVDSTHVARFQCYCGETAKGTLQNFTSTSNSAVTVTDPGTWTRSELQNAQLRFEIGYYGGRMLGITWTVTYSIAGYVCTITNVTTDHEIVVSNASSSNPTIYYKLNGSWVAATAVYKKINGSWVLQSTLSSVFDANTNYVKG